MIQVAKILALQALMLVMLLFTHFAYATNSTFSRQFIEDAKKGVVTIKVNDQIAAYGEEGTSGGTGFLVDKQKGIFVTNQHIASIHKISNFTLTFHDGREMDAEFLYNDPRHDFAFLRVSKPRDIAKNITELQLHDTEPKLQDQVLIIGNNEGSGFSVQTGVISDLQAVSGFFPGRNYAINLNTAGGSSGSPIFATNQKVIALNYAGRKTYGIGLSIKYIIDALKYIKADSYPPRKTTGAIFNYSSLDRAVKFLDFPTDELKKHILKYPTSRAKGIIISDIMNQTPASEKLQIGDFLVKINGVDVEPNLYEIDKLHDNLADEVWYTIIRSGKQMNIKSKIYDVHKTKIRRMLVFGGAVFYEADELMKMLYGANNSDVLVSNVDNNSPFRSSLKNFQNIDHHMGTPLYKINKISTHKITKLDDVISAIKSLRGKKNFVIHSTALLPHVTYSRSLKINLRETLSEIEYFSLNVPPVLLEFNKETKKWDETYITGLPKIKNHSTDS